MISLIAAVAEDYAIGVGGDLPWRLPDDFKWFMAKTIGKPCIMGRRTFESLGKPLSRRENIVVTRDTGFRAEGAIIVHDLEAALTHAKGAPETMILGGATIYEALLDRADRFYLTVVHHKFGAADTYFPGLAESDWEVVASERHDADERHAYAFTFLTLDRVAAGGARAACVPKLWFAG